MDYVYEIAVMHYLTRLGDAFVCPQFPTKDDKGGIWSTPDFVLLDFSKREIAIIEVSSASDVSNLRARVVDHDNRWVAKLKNQLSYLKCGIVDWPMVVKVFVRGLNKTKFENLKLGIPVFPEALEDVMCNWKWEW